MPAKWKKVEGEKYTRLILEGTAFSVCHDPNADLRWDVLERDVWLCSTRDVDKAKKLAQRLAFAAIMFENDKLYETAKKITLEAGMDYTDPRTGKTTKAKKKRAA